MNVSEQVHTNPYRSNNIHKRLKKLRVVVVVVVVVVVHSARILSSDVETKWTRLEKNAFSSNVSSYFALYLFNSIAI